jgi:3-dehydrosphinganine reductase
MEIASAHAVITGGSSGIGLAAARGLGRRGARVTLIARDKDRLDSARLELAEAGVEVAVASADVSDRERLHCVLQEAVETYGPVDILLTSAGIVLPAAFLDLSDDDLERHMAVNYHGTANAVRAVLPSMLERRCGSIILVASAAALIGTYGYGAYTPSKFAVRGLAEVLRSELVDTGVHVGVVYLPDVDTPMLAEEKAIRPPETAAVAGTISPLAPDRVARAIVTSIERERFRIVPDVQTRILATTVGPFHSVFAALVDRAVRRSRR